MSAARLAATITRCRLGKPLVVLDSEPFNGLEIRPHELIVLGQQLIDLAEKAQSLPTTGKHYRPTKVQMGTTSAATTTKGQPS